MSIYGHIICIVLCLLVSFLFIRGFLYGIKLYQLNNSAYKKRKKGETVKEWFFYSRYKEEIPKVLLILYYFILILHPVAIIACSLFNVLGVPLDITLVIPRIVYYFDVTWILILALLFWSPGKKYAYERWIVKKKGYHKNK